MKTRVVHCMKSSYDVYIGRGRCPKTGKMGEWGNPFTHKEGTLAKFKLSSREDAIEKYREWILQQPNLLKKIPFLKGKVLGCWCKPAGCHGDVLAELAEGVV
jgi:hypothetical protein